MRIPSYAFFIVGLTLAGTGCSGNGDPENQGGSSGEGGMSGMPSGGGEAGSSSGGAAGDPGSGGTSSTGGKGGAGGTSVPKVQFGIDKRIANPTCVAPARPTGAANDPFPKTLADTGCFDAADIHRPRPALIPFEVAAPLWSDAAGKRRWMALPDGQTITIETDGDFTFPIGTVLIKEFEIDGVLLETRFLIRHTDGDWAGYTYRWDDAGKVATLLGDAVDYRCVFGETVDGWCVKDLEWQFPSRQNCLACHSTIAGRSLGPEIGQLNTEMAYPGTGRANQLTTLDHIGMFKVSPGDPKTLAAYPSPTSLGGTVAERARAYLHSNCSHCHRPGGVIETAIDLRYLTPLAETKACNIIPSKGQFGLPDSRIILPGNLSDSILRFRMSSTTQNVRMPAIGTALVDTLGLAAVDAWITDLKTCP
jgi:uncharacterized repeat protein (TIGR03806 family)